MVDISIRDAHRHEFDALAAIEIDAFQTLSNAGGVDGVPSAMPHEKLEEALVAGMLFVAVDAQDVPVGFIAAWPFDGGAYMAEIDVAVAYQGKGIGRRLIHSLIDRVKELGLSGVVLTTDRFIAFNAPFYATCGFRVLEDGETPATLKAVLTDEIKNGMQAERRVAMALVL